MPTYEYFCQKCNKKFDYFQSMSEELLGKCPTCKSKKIDRLIGSGGGIIFKGTGFYCTDYKGNKESDKKEEKKEK
ncbi:MAG: zinc ribbon domain-containing protein [Nanoarchaeota archaeon]